MGKPTIWCSWSHEPVDECAKHETGHPHRDVASQLGQDDEPRNNGALVLVWPGNYRDQEVWVASGANIGNWYCLGNEFPRPQVWDPPKVDFWVRDPGPPPPRPKGSIPLQPDWDFVLTRGPVMLLTWDHQWAYAAGWRNGRRTLVQEIESLAEDDSGAYESEQDDGQ
jgi:hypothetical protein